MAQGTCSIDGCEKPVHGRGWCAMHYKRWRLNGDPLVTKALRAYGHSDPPSPTWRSWESMIQRCRVRPGKKLHPDYAGRGITVCEQWQPPGGFAQFLADMGARPKGKTLDRIDNDGNYEPGNCRWATPKEQANNRRVKTHCGYGHLMSGDNVVVKKDGTRRCKACHRRQENARYERLRADPDRHAAFLADLRAKNRQKSLS